MRLMNSAAVLALILGGALATSANAADPYDRGGSTKDGPGYLADDVRTASWTGLWIGLAGGYNFFNSELDFTHDRIDGEGVRHNIERANINGLGAEGLFGEVQVGYDHQIGNNLVLGVFGGLNLSDAEFEASQSFGDDAFSSGLTADYEYGGVIGPRLGFVRGNSMFYVAGGWAFAKLGDVDFHVSEGPSPDSLEGPDLSGFFGEIGLEHRIAKGVRLGVAGRYTDYGKETLWSNEDPNCPKEIEVDVDSLSAMVTLKVELGGLRD